jgi:hypothetical protein
MVPVSREAWHRHRRPGGVGGTVFLTHLVTLVVPTIDRPTQRRALRRVEVMTALGAAVSSLEYLAARRDFAPGGLLSWQTARARYRWMSGRNSRNGRREKVLAAVFDRPGIEALFAVRVLAAAALIAPGTPRSVRRTAATTFLAATNYAVAARSPYGSDGSEAVLSISLTTLALGRLVGDDAKVREACLWFIALQSVFSYGIAGAAKAISPVWRDGTGVRDIFRTHAFGQKHVFEVLRDRPRLARLLGVTTIAGEMLFPLVLVAPRRAAQALLAVGGGFHVGNAFVMGLNRFVWAFIGTYPAIAYCARSLGENRK